MIIMIRLLVVFLIYWPIMANAANPLIDDNTTSTSTSVVFVKMTEQERWQRLSQCLSKEELAIVINSPDDGMAGMTAVHKAIIGGDFRLLKWMIAHGGDPKITDGVNRNGLHFASGNKTIFNYLLEVGVPIKKDHFGAIPLAPK